MVKVHKGYIKEATLKHYSELVTVTIQIPMNKTHLCYSSFAVHGKENHSTTDGWENVKIGESQAYTGIRYH